MRRIPLEGPLSQANAEVSGLAWHGDHLILMPQHPFRMSGSADFGLLFALPRKDIEAFLNGHREEPLRPHPITLLAPQLEERSPMYQGCEALSFNEDRAYLATEAVANAETDAMRGYIFSGILRNDTLRLNTRRRASLRAQTEAHNMAYEALLTSSERVVALYEANGRNVNPHPRAPAFSLDLQPLGFLSFPPLEYRLTDVTALDARGRFWLMNYFFPRESQKLQPAPDPLARSPHSGTSPPHVHPVERLVEFRLTESGIYRTSTSPLHLSLLPGTPRNWEGIARFRSPSQGPGFLLVTDQYPDTMLGFVAAPTNAP